LVIKGARQVGKTHAVREFGRENFKRVFEFNFENQPLLQKIFHEDLQPDRIITELSFFANEQIEISDLIFFDEIQDCPHALTSLKYFAEKRPQQAVIAAGSLLGLTLGDTSFPVGKVSYLWLGPLSFEEFLAGLDDSLGVEALHRARKIKKK